MAEMTLESLRRTVLRAEIMALLHDVGKLHWYFIQAGTTDSQKDAEGKETSPSPYQQLLQKKGVEEEERLRDEKASPKNIQKKLQHYAKAATIHTTEFLARNFWEDDALKKLRARLTEPLPEGWLEGIPGEPLQVLGSLLYAHHGGRDWGRTKSEDLSHLIPLIMYADTTDSLYTKGAETCTDNTQSHGIFLTSPFGRLEAEITSESVTAAARALHEKLVEALDGWQAWDGAELAEKRKVLGGILHSCAAHHLAETRLPNNDVSLWQHSSSVAGLFKALLAGHLLSGTWDDLLRGKKKELAHADQRLALLAFRWDSDAYMARSLRSFEILGRQERLRQLAERLKRTVEEDLALGNEIYRDRQGICFLVPDLTAAADGSLAATLREKLFSCMEEASRKATADELLWSIHSHACGLQLGDFLAFWHDPGKPLCSGPRRPAWQEEWQSSEGRRSQVCPRCGVHPADIEISRLGSRGDIACASCRELSRQGKALLPKGDAQKTGQGKAFFLDFGAGEQDDAATARVALIQGVFSLAALQNREGRSWAQMLAPDENSRLPDLETVKESWCQLCESSGENEDLRKSFAKWLGMTGSFCQQDKEGWCREDAVQSPDLKVRIVDFVKCMVFGDELPHDVDEIAKGLLLWGARQHPAPSRLARVWEELGSFTAWASGLGDTDMAAADWPRIPLTRDVTSFQILVPAGDAWAVLHALQTAYTARFGKVRHILPLHLSAGIFRSKAPLYIAMDAARRFRKLAEQSGPQVWKLLERQRGESGSTRLVWRTPEGLEVVWQVPHTLPNRDADGGLREDRYRTWYFAEGALLPEHLSRLVPGTSYEIWPSFFDYEVLDASVRRYDIHYTAGHRRHYMLHGPGPRPYPLEIIDIWDRYLNGETGLFKDNDAGKRQRKNALELLARLHLDWGRWDGTRESLLGMAHDVLRVTMPELSEELSSTAEDGSFFDLCEWADFISK